MSDDEYDRLKREVKIGEEKHKKNLEQKRDLKNQTKHL